MDARTVRNYRDRWRAVAAIEQQELRALTPAEHWRQLNRLARLAGAAGLAPETEVDTGEAEAWQRWARLKGAG